jgi:alpha-D-ribose 1-methylphosphonate 5-triphosphate synthase subunit PhnL
VKPEPNLPSPPIILDVRALSKRFEIHHLERRVPAFEALSFTLRAGQFLLVSGPNGVGKSTLLRCLYRSYLPSSGAAFYHARAGIIDLATAHDVDIVRLRSEEIGHVSQFLRPRPRVSALELVAEPCRDQGHSAEAAENLSMALLASFGLKRELWRAYPSTFSGGEQQKVNLARAFAAPRRLLLLDEPTASLDAGARAALVSHLAGLKSQGVAMIGVFHHPEDVRSLLDGEIALHAPEGIRLESGEVAHVAV